MNLQGKGTQLILVAGGTLAATTLVIGAGLPEMVARRDFSYFNTIKWGSVIVAIGGIIYFIATKKLLHLEIIEVGEVGFRTRYGQPVYHKHGPLAGQPLTYHPGDRVIVIPIIADIVIVSTRLRVTTVKEMKGTFKGKNIQFSLSIEWQLLADIGSLFKAAFSLHDVVRDNEKSETLDSLVANRVLVVVDSQLGDLEADQNGLPELTGLTLYPPLLTMLENHGPIVNSVEAFSRTIAPEEKPKEGLLEGASRLVA